MCTNETVNIWSHLLGLLYFMFLTLHDNFFFLPQNRADFGDHLTFTILDFCFQVESSLTSLPPDTHPHSQSQCDHALISSVKAWKVILFQCTPPFLVSHEFNFSCYLCHPNLQCFIDEVFMYMYSK